MEKESHGGSKIVQNRGRKALETLSKMDKSGLNISLIPSSLHVPMQAKMLQI